MSNLQTYYHFKLDFQNMGQHTGVKWIIHGTKRRKDNQLQSLELPCRMIYIPNGPINNKSALVLVKARSRAGAEPLFDPMVL